jgi:hypothetical protein
MSLYRPRTLLLAAVALLVAASARAESPDPLRLVPQEADVVLQAKDPRKLVETVTALQAFQDLQAVGQVKEFLDSTNYRRFLQLVAYVEKEMGAKWPDLLDRVAGGGVVVATKIAPDPAPALFVVQGKDEKAVQQFAKLALDVIEQELARQESKDRIETGSYRDVKTHSIGKQFNAAVVGSAFLVSNNDKGLEAAIDLHLDGPKKSLAATAAMADARKLLPADPLLVAWLNLEKAHAAPEAKGSFKLPRDVFPFTILFGGNLDVFGRAPFVCAGVYAEKDGFLATLRLPAGKDGMSADRFAHVPPDKGVGSLPPLEPKGALFSTSFYLNVGQFWEHRAELFSKDEVKAVEEFDKNSATFLGGTSFSQLLAAAGSHHRFVAVSQTKPGYKVKPKTEVPAFAVVTEMADPDTFGPTVETGLRSAALLGSVQTGLRLKEEKHGDVNIVGYRFPEDKPLKADVNDIRFNFSPCFFQLGKHFVVSSTIELGHELADLLIEEDKGPKDKGQPAAVRSMLYARGAAESLKATEDILVTQAILDQALTPAEAREQVRKLIDVVSKLGVLTTESRYGEKDWRYDFKLTLGK